MYHTRPVVGLQLVLVDQQGAEIFHGKLRSNSHYFINVEPGTSVSSSVLNGDSGNGIEETTFPSLQHVHARAFEGSNVVLWLFTTLTF